MTKAFRFAVFILSITISGSVFSEMMQTNSLQINNTTRGINTVEKPVNYTAHQFGQYHALIIGNNSYHYLPKLRTSINDVRVISNILQTDYNFSVTLLENATRNEVLRTLNEYRQTLTENDNLLIYYAGHGILDEAANEGFWLPIDAQENDPANWISNSRITTNIRAMLAKHVLVVADSCYAGTLTRGIRAEKRIPKYLQKIIHSRARSALVSGGLEPVDDGFGKHSPFARAFINALKHNKGVLETAELFTQIRRPVILNSDQIPRYSDIRKAGHEGGDFLFVARTATIDPNEPSPNSAIGYTASKPIDNTLEKSEFSAFNIENQQIKPLDNFTAKNGLNDYDSGIQIPDFASINRAAVYWSKQHQTPSIRIESTPGNAVIHINGIEMGATPFTMKIHDDKYYDIEIAKEGYQAWNSSIDIRKNKSAHIKVNLQKIFQDKLLDGSNGPQMVEIPAGEFVMGSNRGYSNETPVHWVVLEDSYAMGKYEISFAEYDFFAQITNRPLPNDEGWGRGQRPVINITWEDANAYANWLSQQTGNTYRLPSEAEWEYAARAGSAAAFPWGNSIDQNRANCAGCNKEWVIMQPELTGAFQANRFGLHDTNGNVNEWTHDCWNDSYEQTPRDGKAWQTNNCSNRVVRGGAWSDTPENIRSAYRENVLAENANNKTGFRLVREINARNLLIQTTELD